MMADPGDTPVTGTSALVEPAAIVTVAGTEATPGVPELSFTTRPLAGAAAKIYLFGECKRC